MFHLFVRVMLLQGKIFCNIFATVVLAVEILVSWFGLSDFFLWVEVAEMLCGKKSGYLQPIQKVDTALSPVAD